MKYGGQGGWRAVKRFNRDANIAAERSPYRGYRHSQSSEFADSMAFSLGILLTLIIFPFFLFGSLLVIIRDWYKKRRDRRLEESVRAAIAAYEAAAQAQVTSKSQPLQVNVLVQKPPYNVQLERLEHSAKSVTSLIVSEMDRAAREPISDKSRMEGIDYLSGSYLLRKHNETENLSLKVRISELRLVLMKCFGVAGFVRYRKFDFRRVGEKDLELVEQVILEMERYAKQGYVSLYVKVDVLKSDYNAYSSATGHCRSDVLRFLSIIIDDHLVSVENEAENKSASSFFVAILEGRAGLGEIFDVDPEKVGLFCDIADQISRECVRRRVRRERRNRFLNFFSLG